MLDQGSHDSTVPWLREHLPYACVVALEENVGICRGLNFVLDRYCSPGEYDVIVRFDNDCEVVQPCTLRTLARLSMQSEAILAPRVLGLDNPPAAMGEFSIGEYTVDETSILGGVFMCIPARLFSVGGYRFDERMPLWAGDEQITSWYRQQGGRCGYVRDWTVNHYETTQGQHRQYPWYFERRVREGGPA